MEIKIDKCDNCGKQGYIIPSNNPLVKSICLNCINSSIDVTNLEHFAFFCRTFNYKADVNLYLNCLEKDKNAAIKLYVESIDNQSYKDTTTDKWKEIEQEWQKVKTRRQLLEKINPLKKDFIERASEKWGYEYSFEDLMKLETQYNSIISNLGMTNPATIENVKKYCKASLLVDLMIAGGESKAIVDSTNALAKLGDLCQIKEMSETASEGTIKTVSDLYKYMEDHGFEFNYYDKVDRDVVDATIKDIQASIRNEIINAIGLDIEFETIKNDYMRSQEDNLEQQAVEEVPIQQIMEQSFVDDTEQQELDRQLQSEDIIFEDEE